MVASEVSTTFLDFMIVALRLTTRIWIVRNVAWDDYTILLAAFGKIIDAGLIITELHYDFGRHRVDLIHEQYIEFMKYFCGEWIQIFQILMFTKLSICFFLLLRIPVGGNLVRPMQGATVALIISNIVLNLLWFFQCNSIISA